MERHTRFSVVAIVLAVAVAASAAPPPIAQRKLANGLTVIVAENHSQPLITIEVGVKNGSMTEPPEYNGLSHLYEHMFFKANAALPDQLAFMSRLRELGMSFNGTTGTERVNYYFTTTSDHFAESMAFMRDAITSPLFDARELERERVVVTGEMDRNEANPFYHFHHSVEQRLWWKHPTRKDPLGTRSTVLGATRDMMQTIRQRYYVPGNAVLIAAGDVRAPEVFALAEQLYGAWPAGEDPFLKYPLVEHPPITRSEVVVVEQPVQTVSLSFNWIGPSVIGADADLSYAIDRMALVLQEPSSRFQRETVESGACVAAGFAWETALNAGPVRMTAEARPDKVDECAAALRAQLPRMKEADYFTDEEWDNALRRATVDQMRERERPSAFAHVLSNAWCITGLDYYFTYVDRMRTAPRADVARFLDRFVLGKPFVIGAMVSPEMRAAGLDGARFARLAGVAAVSPAAAATKAGSKKGGAR